MSVHAFSPDPNHFLKGRTALVTGSVQGIGLAIAKALGSAGAKVAVHGLASPEEAMAAVEAVKASGAEAVQFFDGDLKEPQAIKAMMERVMAWAGLDILVNNAGVQTTKPFEEVTDALWEQIISINLSGAFYTMRSALPHMAKRGYGRVINIASVHGLVASREKAPYVASKHGLIGLSKAAALEYAQMGSRESGGVTVNCICPGWTETALIEPQIMARAQAFGGDRQAGVKSLLSEKQPSQRLSLGAEVGLLALWLSSPLAHNVTGTSIPIDGGWTAQ